MIVLGNKQPRTGTEAPQLVQYGYLFAIVGVFILLVQKFSIPGAMLIFCGADGRGVGAGQVQAQQGPG